MARPKKPVVAMPPVNPNVVQGLLAKAKAMVQSVGDKRKADDSLASSPAPVVKPKGAPSPPSKAPAVKSPEMPPPPVPPTTRVRGKTPDPPPPPAKAKATTLTLPAVPSKASAPSPPAKASVPAPAPTASKSASSAFERTREVLEKAKQDRLALAAANKDVAVETGKEPTPAGLENQALDHKKTESDLSTTTDGELEGEGGAEGLDEPSQEGHVHTPAEVPQSRPPTPEATEMFVTPPPKASNFSSPSPPGPEAKQLYSDSSFDDGDSRWLQGHSQRAYYGAQGKSWWSRDADWYGYYWDHYNGRGVYAVGDESWIYNYPSWSEHSSWDDVPRSSPPPEGSPPSESRSLSSEDTSGDVRLAARQPTFNSPAAEGTPETAGEAPENKGEAGDEAALPADDLGNQESTPVVKQELESGNTGKSWKTDKHGKPLTPTALYMRFYRQLRSTLASYIHKYFHS